MKVDEEKQYGQIALVDDEQDDTPVVQDRWIWVRRFILCIILITLFMQSLAPMYSGEEDIFIATDFTTQQQQDPSSHLVLHTGFPPSENVSGLPIYNGKSAATAFSPNPSNSKSLKYEAHIESSGESWWDRLFPNRHVHLINVQLPVIPLDTKNNFVEATISICASKKEKFGLGRPQIPDMDNCVETALIKTDEIDVEDEFGVLEWVPEGTIVLQKSKLYWLVIQTQSDPFNWVYSEGGSNELGTAYETEVGWEFKLEGEPIPSAMIMVEDHRK